MWRSANSDGLPLECSLGLPPTPRKVLCGWGLPTSCSEQLFTLENLNTRKRLELSLPNPHRRAPLQFSAHSRCSIDVPGCVDKGEMWDLYLGTHGGWIRKISGK